MERLRRAGEDFAQELFRRSRALLATIDCTEDVQATVRAVSDARAAKVDGVFLRSRAADLAEAEVGRGGRTAFDHVAAVRASAPYLWLGLALPGVTARAAVRVAVLRTHRDTLLRAGLGGIWLEDEVLNAPAGLEPPLSRVSAAGPSRFSERASVKGRIGVSCRWFGGITEASVNQLDLAVALARAAVAAPEFLDALVVPATGLNLEAPVPTDLPRRELAPLLMHDVVGVRTPLCLAGVTLANVAFNVPFSRVLIADPTDPATLVSLTSFVHAVA